MAGVTSAPAPHQAAHSPSKADAASALVPPVDADDTSATQQPSPLAVESDAAGPNAAPNNGTADQKKDKKPRRERLPLPDPIPLEPVKRYPEPNKADHLREVEEEDAKLKACFDRLNSARAFFDERQKIRDAGKPAFESARKRFNDLNEECRLFMEARKEITTKLKALKEQDIAARNASASTSNEVIGAGKDGNEALKNIRTIEELEDRITDMQYRMETESLPILEEKRLVAQISFLQHKGRDFIVSKDQSIKDEKAAKEVRTLTRKDLEEARAKQDALIDSAKAKLDAQKKVVDNIRADQEAEIKKLQESTSDIDRDAERKKIAEFKANIRKLREDYQTKLDEWYLNERIFYEQQKIAKRKRYEALQAEREARRKAWEAEQAQYPEPDPYQEQKDMVAGLTVYLQTLLGETTDKPSVNLMPTKDGSAPSLKTTSTTREIKAKGKAIGKSTVGLSDGFESLAFSDFVKKSSKSKGKKGRRSTAPTSVDTANESGDTLLKPHSIDYIAAFTELDIKPPNKLSEVRGALEQVKEKKAYYDNLPKPTEEEKAKLAANKSKKQAAVVHEKNAQENGVDIMNGDGSSTAFPDLLGENSAAGSASATRDISGPSFMAVASGAAPAPPPTPAVSTADMLAVGDVTTGNIMDAAGMGVDGVMTDDPMAQGDSILASTDPALTEA